MKRDWGIAAALSAALAAVILCGRSPAFAAALARGVSYPAMARLVSLAARAPFPLSEALIILLIALLGFGLLRAGNPKALGRWLRAALRTASAFLLVYAIFWIPVASVPKLAPHNAFRAEPGALTALVRELAAGAALAREEMPKTAPDSARDIAKKAEEALYKAEGGKASIKAARCPEFLSALGAAGMYLPWTGEALINPQEPIFAQPFAACHEGAHALGYGREDEANYIAFRACMAGDSLFRYSGYLMALRYAMADLRTADEAAFRSAVELLPNGVYKDFYRLNGMNSAAEAKSDRVRDGAAEVFLRLSGQKGLESYGELTNRLLWDAGAG